MTSETDPAALPRPTTRAKSKKAPARPRAFPIKIVPIEQVERLKKPDWIRVKAASAERPVSTKSRKSCARTSW
jgi:lipoic acid synthetase